MMMMMTRCPPVEARQAERGGAEEAAGGRAVQGPGARPGRGTPGRSPKTGQQGQQWGPIDCTLSRLDGVWNAIFPSLSPVVQRWPRLLVAGGTGPDALDPCVAWQVHSLEGLMEAVQGSQAEVKQLLHDLHALEVDGEGRGGGRGKERDDGDDAHDAHGGCDDEEDTGD
jgi:hypothetical protein